MKKIKAIVTFKNVVELEVSDKTTREEIKELALNKADEYMQSSPPKPHCEIYDNPCEVDYLENGNDGCPNCDAGYGDIEMDEYEDVDHETLIHSFECQKCKAEWHETLKLIAVDLSKIKKEKK